MINKHTSFGAAVLMGFGLLAGPGRFANTVQAAGQEANASAKPAPPIVFQAAGPTIASIQSMVDAFRAEGITSDAWITRIEPAGARIVVEP